MKHQTLNINEEYKRKTSLTEGNQSWIGHYTMYTTTETLQVIHPVYKTFVSGMDLFDK